LVLLGVLTAWFAAKILEILQIPSGLTLMPLSGTSGKIFSVVLPGLRTGLSRRSGMEKDGAAGLLTYAALCVL